MAYLYEACDQISDIEIDFKFKQQQTCSVCQDLPTLQFWSKSDYPSWSYCPFFINFFFLIYTPSPRRGRGVYCFTSVRPSVCPSVRPSKIFFHIVGSVFGPVRFLLPVCRLSWFLYTLNIYVHFSSHFSQQLLMTEIWYLVTTKNVHISSMCIKTN
jgi:hypothetical protein